MFHQGDPRFRAWLTAFAGAQPRAPRRLRDEIRRLTGLLAERTSESERLDRELAQSAWERAALEADRKEVLGYVAKLEAERLRLLEHVARLEADRRNLLARLATLEAALEADRQESARWLRVLPMLRVRVPGGRANADRLRALRNRLLGR